MIKDITLGQYFPLDSIIHKLDPRFKILATFIYIVLVFFANSVLTYSLVALFCFGVVFLSKVKLSLVLKSVKPLLLIIVFTAVINLFFTSGTDIIWKWKFLKITYTGVENAVNMALRLIFLVMGSSLLTYTTSPILLTDGIERLLKPFSKIGLPSHEIAMMMSIALRFIPTFVDETDRIMKAQMARGTDFDDKNFIKKIKSYIPILIPLFISAWRKAEDLATAMNARCYRGGEGRTKFKVLKFSKIDLLLLIITIFLFAAIVLLNKFV